MKCDKCGKVHVVGSLQELKDLACSPNSLDLESYISKNFGNKNQLSNFDNVSVESKINKFLSTLKNKNVSLISLNVSSSVALEEKVEQLQ